MATDKYGFDRRLYSRASNLGETLQKTNRILTGNRAITVKVDTKGEGTYSQKPAITLGVEKLDLFNTDDVLAIMGLNYHEVAHILFTPEIHYEKFYIHKADGSLIYLQPTINFLEEGRIETLFGASYPRAKHFFTIAVIRTLLKRLESVNSISLYPPTTAQGFSREQYHALWVHLLTFGRKYLPANLRNAISQYAESRFTASTIQDIRKAEELIDRYRTLRSDEIVDKGIPIAHELSQLFPELFEILQQSQKHDPMRGYGDTRPKPAKPQEIEAQQQARSDAEDGYEEIELGEEEDEGEGAQETSESPQDVPGEGSGDADTGEDGSDRPGGSGGDSADSESKDQEDDPGTSAGVSKNAPPIPTLGDVAELAASIGELIESDQSIADDVQEIMDALDSTDQKSDGSHISRKRTPTSDESDVANRMSREFEKLASEVAPGWNYGSDSGRLNVNRAMDPDSDPEEMWDEWEEGRESDASVEAVICVDLSGSMSSGGRILGASAFCWVLTRALAEIDANISVLGFSNAGQVFTLRGRDDPHRPEMVDIFSTFGGTSPAYTLNVAKDILNSSQLDNRVLIVMTDGEWSPNNYDQSGRYEDLLADTRAHKTLIGIGIRPRTDIARLFDVVSQCSDVKDLSEPILRTIERISRQRVGH